MRSPCTASPREFLKDKPLFKDVADEFLDFIGEAPLVAHNASFDVGFLNAELARLARPPLTFDRVVDTLVLARRRHPAGPNSLDALCKRYGIDNSAAHQARRAARLACCWPASTSSCWASGRRRWASAGNRDRHSQRRAARQLPAQPRPQPLRSRPSDGSRDCAHREFVKTLGPKPLWLRVHRPRP